MEQTEQIQQQSTLTEWVEAEHERLERALRRLRKEELVGRKSMQINGKEGMLYYRWDSAMSGPHKFMEGEIMMKLEARGIAYELAKPGEDKPDIMTKDFDVEIETGLKHDLDLLAQRLTESKKRTYVIVPNEAEQERYKKAINNTSIVTMQLNCDIIAFEKA